MLGAVLEDLWGIAIIWLLLTLLTGGRLSTRSDRVLVGVFVLQNVLWIGSYLFAEREGNFLLVHADAGVVEALDSAGAMVISVGCLSVAGVIGVRWKRASPPRRRALLPAVAGISSLVFFAVANQAPSVWLAWIAFLSLLTIPAGFLSACCARGSRAAGSRTSSASCRRCAAPSCRRPSAARSATRT